MTESILSRACAALDARKDVAIDDAGNVTDPRAYVLGLGVSAEEVEQRAMCIGAQAPKVAEDLGVPSAVASAWADGLLTGLLAGRLERDDEAAERLRRQGPAPLVNTTLGLSDEVRERVTERVVEALLASAGRRTLLEASQAAADVVLEELVRLTPQNGADR